jgi:hypothetical protein
VCITLLRIYNFLFALESFVFMHTRTWALVVEVKRIMHRGDVVEPPAHIISLRGEERRHSIYPRAHSVRFGAVYIRRRSHVFKTLRVRHSLIFSVFGHPVQLSLGWGMNIMGHFFFFVVVFSSENCGDIMSCSKRNHAHGSGFSSHNLCICLLSFNCVFKRKIPCIGLLIRVFSL